jgi:hypothetical protein
VVFGSHRNARHARQSPATTTTSSAIVTVTAVGCRNHRRTQRPRSRVPVARLCDPAHRRPQRRITPPAVKKDHHRCRGPGGRGARMAPPARCDPRVHHPTSSPTAVDPKLGATTAKAYHRDDLERAAVNRVNWCCPIKVASQAQAFTIAPDPVTRTSNNPATGPASNAQLRWSRGSRWILPC